MGHSAKPAQKTAGRNERHILPSLRPARFLTVIYLCAKIVKPGPLTPQPCSPLSPFDALYMNDFCLRIEFARHLDRFAGEGLGALRVVELEDFAR